MLADTMHERMKGWFARIILGIIILSFALFGVDAYNRAGASASVVAQVGDRKITQPEFEEAFKAEQNRLRSAGEKNPAILNGKALKLAVLDRLVQEQLLIQQAAKQGYSANEASILALIQREPSFQENGQFSEARYNAFLSQNRLSSKQYLSSIAQNRMIRELLALQADTGIVSHSVADRLADIMAEQREVSKVVLHAADFAPKVSLDPQQIQTYYTAHPELFRVSEQARVEYIVFTPEAVLAHLQVTDAEAKAYYAAHATQFAQPESRDVSHILIRALADATPAERQAAQEKAQQILKQVQQNPQAFAELAKKYSQDPLTAAQGGSFGVIQRGAIFKQVEDAAFNMKAGEVRGLISSPAGFHIVQVKTVTGGGQRSFDEVKVAVMEAAKRDLALRKFNEAVDLFGDAVYAKSDSLKPAAEKYQLTIQSSDWFGRAGPTQGVLKNERLLSAIFSGESVKDKRNTEAIEVAPNTLVAARIVEYKPAANKPLETVKGEIESRLRIEQASVLAGKNGQADVTALKQGKDVTGLKFDTPSKLDRAQAIKTGMDQTALQAVFRVPVKTLPAYTGVTLANGDYAIYKISALASNETVRQQAKQFMPLSLAQTESEQIAGAYLDSLRREEKVSIKQDILDKIGAER
jgi:peptidyl-prolyl cis-trans isomerase D